MDNFEWKNFGRLIFKQSFAWHVPNGQQNSSPARQLSCSYHTAPANDAELRRWCSTAATVGCCVVDGCIWFTPVLDKKKILYARRGCPTATFGGRTAAHRACWQCCRSTVLNYDEAVVCVWSVGRSVAPVCGAIYLLRDMLGLDASVSIVIYNVVAEWHNALQGVCHLFCWSCLAA